MTNEIINFGAGPAKLPPQVIHYCNVQLIFITLNKRYWYT